MVQDAVAYLNKQGELRDSGDQDNFISKNLADSNVPNLATADWMSFFADIPAGAVQYGSRTNFCDFLKPYDGQGPEAYAQAVLDYDPSSTPDDYARETVASTVIDVNSSARPWNFQVCTEYGWF